MGGLRRDADGSDPEHRPDGKHIVPVEPDAVTFTAMIMACAYRDDFEQSRALLLDMKQSAIESTLSVHNALINACASRAHSLANLGKAKKNQLQRLKVETDPAVALLKATQQLGQLEDEGHAPDGYTYLALLRCCAGAGEVARAQRLLSRMLDTGVAPNELHFDALLRVRAGAVDQAERPVERPPEGRRVRPALDGRARPRGERARAQFWRNSGAILRNYPRRRPCLHR